MEWDEYLDDGAFYREALDRLIREDNEFDPEPYAPREEDRYDDDDEDDEEDEEYNDDYDEEEEDRYEEMGEDDEADEEDEDDENEEDDDEDEDSDDVNEEEYNEEKEAKAFHEAVKKQNEEWQHQMQGDGLPESIFASQITGSLVPCNGD